MNTFQAGQHVTTSGFAGRVIRMYSPGMVEIRLGSGVVCVPVGDVIAA
jgi:preprotein translocase subunit YajC